MNRRPTTIFLAGDSTVATNGPDTWPQAGWGQMIQYFFTDDVVFENHAQNGRSTRSFINEGRLAAIEKEIKAGDYLFIQFGHNDSKPDSERCTEPDTAFRENLRTFITAAQKHNAIPVLVTSVHRRRFDDAGNFKDTLAPYHAAMRAEAKAAGVILIDLGESSRKLFETLGAQGTERLFMHLAAGRFPNYPEGITDNTHFTIEGAKEIAGLVVAEIRNLIPELGVYCRETAAPQETASS